MCICVYCTHIHMHINMQYTCVSVCVLVSIEKTENLNPHYLVWWKNHILYIKSTLLREISSSILTGLKKDFVHLNVIFPNRYEEWSMTEPKTKDLLVSYNFPWHQEEVCTLGLRTLSQVTARFTVCAAVSSYKSGVLILERLSDPRIYLALTEASVVVVAWVKNRAHKILNAFLYAL